MSYHHRRSHDAEGILALLLILVFPPLLLVRACNMSALSTVALSMVWLLVIASFMGR